MEENDHIKEMKDVIANLNIEISKTLAQNERIMQISYYEKMQILPEQISKYGFELNVLAVEKERIDEDGKTNKLFELYDSDNNKIGTIVNGKIHFDEKYLNLIKERCKDDSTALYDELLALDGKIDYQELLEKNKDKEFAMTEKEIDEYIKDEKTREDGVGENQKEEEEEELQEDEKDNESSIEKIAKEKGIPTHSIVFVRSNSTLYKNHPELERNMFFYRDTDGIVKAEYIDKDGKSQPSEFINNSKTLMRQVVSVGKDGSNIERDVPYQFMTSSISSKGSNVREIGFTVDINMGYLEIEEARLGSNGEWTSHEVEMQGRDYNSYEVNESTDLVHKSSNPDKISDAYSRVEDSGFNEDGIQMNELDPKEIVERFIEEGYQRDEAIDIVNYMIGEEQLTEDQAKERVNDEIRQREENEREIDGMSLEER